MHIYALCEQPLNFIFFIKMHSHFVPAIESDLYLGSLVSKATVVQNSKDRVMWKTIENRKHIICVHINENEAVEELM